MSILTIKAIDSTKRDELCLAVKVYHEEFRPIHPINVIWLSSSKTSKINLKHCLAKSDLRIEFYQYEMYKEKQGLILGNMEELFSFKFPFSIGKRIFCLDVTSFTIWEIISLENVDYKMKLGRIENNALQMRSDIQRQFLKRRRNFRGIVINVMTEIQASNVMLDPLRSNLSIYHENNHTYEITGSVAGMYISILKEFEKSLNFTARLFKRKDGVWGISEIENQKILGNGMIGNLIRNEAEMIVASIDVIEQRFIGVDFLQPISGALAGIYIKADDIEEKFDFMSYVSPLRTISWITLMILSGLMSLFMFLLIKTLNKEAFSIVSS